MNSSDFWIGAALGGIIGNAAFLLLLFVIKFGWRTTIPTMRTVWRVSSTLASVRMIAFNRSRDDYLTSHKRAGSVAHYASHAKRELLIVSITLASGLSFDGICDALRKLLERDSPVSVTISLLNPACKHLMQAVSSGHETDAATMAEQVTETWKN